MPEDGLEGFREYEFARLVQILLPSLLDTSEVITEPKLEGGLRPDFMTTFADGSIAIVEVKGVTPNTQLRLEEVAQQLSRYGETYKASSPDANVTLVLVTPGTLSAEHHQFLHSRGIDKVIDGHQIIQGMQGLDVTLYNRFNLRETIPPPTSTTTTEGLLKELDEIPAGKDDWSRYQRVCGNILEFLFCPPLEKPISEHSNREGTNRRDFILPNYTTDSTNFWAQMRLLYEAHFVVVDAKNWSGQIDKDEVLKIANYLSAHGAGLFGILMSRKGGDSSAEVTQREQWMQHRKMIVILDDSDVRQMLAMHTSNGSPADLIRQKIEDFRLSF